MGVRPVSGLLAVLVASGCAGRTHEMRPGPPAAGLAWTVCVTNDSAVADPASDEARLPPRVCGELSLTQEWVLGPTGVRYLTGTHQLPLRQVLTQVGTAPGEAWVKLDTTGYVEVGLDNSPGLRYDPAHDIVMQRIRNHQAGVFGSGYLRGDTLVGEWGQLCYCLPAGGRLELAVRPIQ